MADEPSMAGRVAVVTGAGGGIGSATCRKLAEAGACVVLTYRQSEEQTRAVVEGLPGDGHLVLQADVTDSAAVYRMAEKICPFFQIFLTRIIKDFSWQEGIKAKVFVILIQISLSVPGSDRNCNG